MELFKAEPWKLSVHNSNSNPCTWTTQDIAKGAGFCTPELGRVKWRHAIVPYYGGDHFLMWSGDGGPQSTVSPDPKDEVRLILCQRGVFINMKPRTIDGYRISDGVIALDAKKLLVMKTGKHLAKQRPVPPLVRERYDAFLEWCNNQGRPLVLDGGRIGKTMFEIHKLLALLPEHERQHIAEVVTRYYGETP